jgi:hypothetical protein
VSNALQAAAMAMQAAEVAPTAAQVAAANTARAQARTAMAKWAAVKAKPPGCGHDARRSPLARHDSRLARRSVGETVGTPRPPVAVTGFAADRQANRLSTVTRSRAEISGSRPR